MDGIVCCLQEDGVSVGLDFFHEKLPLEKMLAGKPIEWNLSKPSISSFFYELGGGVYDLFSEPYKGAKEEGNVAALLLSEQFPKYICAKDKCLSLTLCNKYMT